jgi:hypothetical protein
VADIDLTPTEEMAANAKRGLELRRKHGRGGTAVGVARARDISNRKTLSPETVRRMHAFFSRHEKNKAGGEDDAGYIAWLLWGGDSGQSWAKRKVEQMDKSENQRSETYKAIAQRLGSAAKNDRPGAKARFAFKVGDRVHAGFGVAGGAGVVGTITKIEDGYAHIQADASASDRYGPKTHKAPLRLVTAAPKKAWESSRPGAKASFAQDARAVAQEILRQLGGGRFMAMVGGKNAMHGTFGGKPGLQVSIGKGAEGGINRLIVTLDPATDTYNMEFWRIGNRGLSTKKVSEASMVYADDLQRVFTDRTKFYTSMSRPGAKAKMGRAEQVMRDGSVHLDFRAAKEWLASVSEDALRYIINDAQKAAKAMPDGNKWNYYHDLSLTAQDELQRRKKKAARPGAKATMQNAQWMQHVSNMLRDLTNERQRVQVWIAGPTTIKVAGMWMAYTRYGKGAAIASRMAYYLTQAAGTPGKYSGQDIKDSPRKGTNTTIWTVSNVPEEAVAYLKAWGIGTSPKAFAGFTGESAVAYDRPGAKAVFATEVGRKGNKAAMITRDGTGTWYAYVVQRGETGIGPFEDMLGTMRSYATEEKAKRAAIKALDTSGFSRPGAKDTNAVREGCKISAEDEACLKMMAAADAKVSDKIRTLIAEGKPQKQAVAIALDLKRRGEL